MQSALFCPTLIVFVVLSLCLLSPVQAQDLHIALLNSDCDGDSEVSLFGVETAVNAREHTE